MVATSPLRSGQAISRMAEGFMVTPALLLQFLQYLARGIRAGPTSESPPRMRPAPAQIKILNRRAVPRPIQQRTHGEELIERKFPVENLPASEPVFFFQIARRNNLVRHNQFRQVGRVLRESLNHRLPERFA